MVLRNRNTAFWLELLIKAKYQEKKMEPKVGAGVISNAPSRIRQKKVSATLPLTSWSGNTGKLVPGTVPGWRDGWCCPDIHRSSACSALSGWWGIGPPPAGSCPEIPEQNIMCTRQWCRQVSGIRIRIIGNLLRIEDPDQKWNNR